MSRFLIAIVLVAAPMGALGSTPAMAAPTKTPTTCGEVKELYRLNTCCGHPTQKMAVAPACPYNFAKPQCKNAEPQAPRDLSTGATGTMEAKAATLNIAQAKKLILSNVHYHLGAEHKSDAYNDGTAGAAYDAAHAGRRLSANPRPGWMCAAASAAETVAYTFQHCKGDVVVGKTYEIHYVRSSAGYDADHLAHIKPDIDQMNDGLGGAANGRGQLNPMLVVQAQVFQIVNDANAPTVADMLQNGGNGWTVKANNADRVMYPGSTTGQSHNNEICSPYAVTWHVDKACNKVAAASFDNMCKLMVERFQLSADLHPHGSRILVDSKYVVPADEVLPLA